MTTTAPVILLEPITAAQSPLGDKYVYHLWSNEQEALDVDLPDTATQSGSSLTNRGRTLSQTISFQLVLADELVVPTVGDSIVQNTSMIKQYEQLKALHNSFVRVTTRTTQMNAIIKSIVKKDSGDNDNSIVAVVTLKESKTTSSDGGSGVVFGKLGVINIPLRSTVEAPPVCGWQDAYSRLQSNITSTPLTQGQQRCLDEEGLPGTFIGPLNEEESENDIRFGPTTEAQKDGWKDAAGQFFANKLLPIGIVADWYKDTVNNVIDDVKESVDDATKSIAKKVKSSSSGKRITKGITASLKKQSNSVVSAAKSKPVKKFISTQNSIKSAVKKGVSGIKKGIKSISRWRL